MRLSPTSKIALYTIISAAVLSVLACGGGGSASTTAPDTTGLSAAAKALLNLNLNALDNYAAPVLPAHYQAETTNTPSANPTTDKIATLGRVLFYDKTLSFNNTVACASCHQASHGFGDDTKLSIGFAGGAFTTAHAMRLGNAAYYRGANGVHSAFWDKRADSLELQATQPIQNAVEMGFDASHGGIAALLTKMAASSYYPELFTFAFGTAQMTEDRIQKALAQFERSMVSTGSRWDTAYATVYNPTAPNKNLEVSLISAGFTASEDRGRHLFMSPPGSGGLNCVSCHAAPSFALTPNAKSNGLDANETTVFKSPSLKNVGFDSAFMHDGRFSTLEQVIEHYNSGVQFGTAVDARLLVPNTQTPRRLNLTQTDKTALVDFLKTLNDTALQNNIQFSTPFK